MKYWEYTELDNWDTIKEKLNAWVDTTPFIQNGFFWNDVKLAELDKAVPELKEALAKKDLLVTYAAIIVARAHASSVGYLQNIHVDDMFGVAARLQLPIRNTENTFTHFFSAPKDKIERRLLPNGHAFWWLNPINAKHETKVCIDRPTYIRTGEPHSVEVKPGTAGVRVTATLRLNHDPGKWLK